MCVDLLDLQVYHPNIDLQGNVCLNILREEWKPILSISAVVYGLQFLFLVISPRYLLHFLQCACGCLPFPLHSSAH